MTMRETSDPELKRLREVAISLLGSDKGNMLANLVRLANILVRLATR